MYYITFILYSFICIFLCMSSSHKNTLLNMKNYSLLEFRTITEITLIKQLKIQMQVTF